MLLRHMVAALAFAATATLAGTTPAMAHAELIASNPAKGASLDVVPNQVQLTFNEPVSPLSITVTGPQGAAWSVGQIAVEGAVVTAPVQPLGPAGPYAIGYTVKSSDGDDVTGTVDFVMNVAAAPATTATTVEASEPEESVPSEPAATQGDAGNGGGGVPAWVWVVVALAALVAAGVLLLRRTRDRPEAPAESSTGESPPQD